MSTPTTILHTEIFGDATKPTLVFVGSLGSNISMWQPQHELEDRFRIVLVDLTGHGASPVPPAPYTIDQMADDVMATLKQKYDITHASFVGLSIGGAIVQSLLTRHAHAVDCAVLACTAAKFGTPDTWQERIDTVREQGVSALAAGVAQRWFTPPFGEQGYYERYTEMISQTAAEGYIGSASALQYFDSHEALAAVKQTPVLVISAADDQSTTPEVCQDLADSIEHAQFVSIDNAAHLVNIEQAKEFNETVSRFVSEHARL
ncbi:alpha/beta fold hydrolase [Corynebacterium aquilae]|uniref:AB hydrolase-1 domain-containing protein n=1 Tax=Corynebacterium aquilae DSM 44791 TaxID=1431546 RepID=A0A1L7CF30_9CORY|nr:alpha/beta fold hydrolase [Corynebacterium aquilae]APT84438.1 hypothetical protein CAQU_04430 [Corynebacterium aquilae DSM 44791]